MPRSSPEQELLFVPTEFSLALVFWSAAFVMHSRYQAVAAVGSRHKENQTCMRTVASFCGMPVSVFALCSLEGDGTRFTKNSAIVTMRSRLGRMKARTVTKRLQVRTRC